MCDHLEWAETVGRSKLKSALFQLSFSRRASHGAMIGYFSSAVEVARPLKNESTPDIHKGNHPLMFQIYTATIDGTHYTIACRQCFQQNTKKASSYHVAGGTRPYYKELLIFRNGYSPHHRWDILLFTPPPGSRARKDSVGHSTCMSVLARRRAIMRWLVG